MAGDLVLVTGGTGMIGFRVLVQLLEAGYQVRAAVRNVAGFEKIKALKPAAPYASQLSHIIVPDITAPGAYDDAVNGVKYVVHLASPLDINLPDDIDYETKLIQPAVKGTLGMLESAKKVSGIDRIVITGSVLSIIGFSDAGSTEILDETRRSAVSEGPFPMKMAAYAASKARAFESVHKWIAENKPSFDVNSILPVFVLGRDDTVTEASQITRGTNGLVMGPLLGHPGAPTPGVAVHVDDVAQMHVKALDPSIPGNQDFLANSQQPRGVEWAQVNEIVKRRYPKEVANGILKVDPAEPAQTLPLSVSSAKAEKAFNFKFKDLEEQVVSVVDHYLELLG
ncbi:hypothetical protein V490_05890 [Pseudogymnoascus sp. VKM F-3557]|nr:hypothetical protein V490_05890 [Pseudogymnoascus sp. VKM F-3557]